MNPRNGREQVEVEVVVRLSKLEKTNQTKTDYVM